MILVALRLTRNTLVGDAGPVEYRSPSLARRRLVEAVRHDTALAGAGSVACSPVLSRIEDLSGEVGKRNDRSGHALRLLAASVATAWAVLVAFYILTYHDQLPEVMFGNDYIAFWTGGAMVRDGQGNSLYDLDAQGEVQFSLRREQAISDGMRAATGRIPYWNPPALALLVIPFTALPASWGYVAWTVVGLLVTVFAVALPLRRHPYRRQVVILLLGFGGVASGVTQGQVNWVFLLPLSLGLLALEKDRPYLGGAILGLLWLKPQYAALFPLVFLLKGRWRELAGMLGMGAFLGAISLAMIGPGGVQMYLQSMSVVGGFHELENTAVCPLLMVNWRAFLLSFWPGTPEAEGRLLMAVLGGTTVALSLSVWRGPWDPASPRFPAQILVLLLASIVAAPHSHFHGMTLLLSPVAFMVARSLGSRLYQGAWIAIFVGGYMLFNVLAPFRAPLAVLLTAASIILVIFQCRGENRVVSYGG